MGMGIKLRAEAIEEAQAFERLRLAQALEYFNIPANYERGASLLMALHEIGRKLDSLQRKKVSHEPSRR